MEEKEIMENGKKTGETGAVLGILMTIVGGCLWGLSGACGQYLFEYKGVTAKWLVPVRLVIAGCIMLVWYLFREKKAAFRIWKKRKNAVDILIYGIAGMMLCQYTYFATIELSNAGTATVLSYIAPVIIMVLVCLMEKRAPKAAELAALVCAVSGIFLIATHGNPRQLAISKEALAMGFLSALTVVIYNLQPRRLLIQFPTAYLLAWAMVIGGVVLSVAFEPWKYSYKMDLQFLTALSAIIVLGTIVAFSCYMTGVKMIGPARASLYACVEPIAATILSAVWLKVPFTVVDLAGFALIIATILILAVKDLKRTED